MLATLLTELKLVEKAKPITHDAAIQTGDSATKNLNVEDLEELGTIIYLQCDAIRWEQFEN